MILSTAVDGFALTKIIIQHLNEIIPLNLVNNEIFHFEVHEHGIVVSNLIRTDHMNSQEKSKVFETFQIYIQLNSRHKQELVPHIYVI